jgi:hypothetical protein
MKALIPLIALITVLLPSCGRSKYLPPKPVTADTPVERPLSVPEMALADTAEYVGDISYWEKHGENGPSCVYYVDSAGTVVKLQVGTPTYKTGKVQLGSPMGPTAIIQGTPTRIITDTEVIFGGTLLETTTIDASKWTIASNATGRGAFYIDSTPNWVTERFLSSIPMDTCKATCRHPVLLSCAVAHPPDSLCRYRCFDCQSIVIP